MKKYWYQETLGNAHVDDATPEMTRVAHVLTSKKSAKVRRWEAIYGSAGQIVYVVMGE